MTSLLQKIGPETPKMDPYKYQEEYFEYLHNLEELKTVQQHGIHWCKIGDDGSFQLDTSKSWWSFIKEWFKALFDSNFRAKNTEGQLNKLAKLKSHTVAINTRHHALLNRIFKEGETPYYHIRLKRLYNQFNLSMQAWHRFVMGQISPSMFGHLQLILQKQAGYPRLDIKHQVCKRGHDYTEIPHPRIDVPSFQEQDELQAILLNIRASKQNLPTEQHLKRIQELLNEPTKLNLLAIEDILEIYSLRAQNEDVLRISVQEFSDLFELAKARYAEDTLIMSHLTRAFNFHVEKIISNAKHADSLTQPYADFSVKLDDYLEAIQEEFEKLLPYEGLFQGESRE